MSRPYLFHSVCLLLALSASVYSQQSGATLTAQLDKKGPKVSPMLYGLMTEEINYSYDGGVYAELVRNRTFGGLNYWSIIENGVSSAAMNVDRTDGPSAALHSSLKLVVATATSKDQAGIQNAGYWGIPVRPETTYQASFYAKADADSIGAVTVSIVNDDTGKAVASAASSPLTAEWKQYQVTLKTAKLAASSTNHLLLTVQHPGSVKFSLVSLFPPTYKDRVNGNRIDIMEKLAAMKPAFLRFPAVTISKAIIFRNATSGRRPSDRSSIVPPIPAPGAIAPPTAWVCSSSSNGAKICACSPS